MTRSAKTRGREATTRHIPPKLALSVGTPLVAPPKGWRWVALSEVARLESGHTPSRQHPEWWGGAIPWLSIQDAREHHGRSITQTAQTTNDLGILKSSARVLPAGTVCLSRTASVGYVVVMGRPMATSQDFVNWICSDAIEPDFLKYLFIAEGDDLLRFASGAVHQTIYFPEAKAFHVCIPSTDQQRRIVAVLDEVLEGLDSATANVEKDLENARIVFENYLNDVVMQRRKGSVLTTLGSEVDLLVGFAFKSKNYTTLTDDIRLLRGDNIGQQELRWGDARRWPSAAAGAFSSYELCEGDVVLAMDRPWVKAGLKYAMISKDDLPCLLVQRVARLRSGSRMSNRFLLYLLGSRVFSRHILGSQTGIGVPHISSSQIAYFAFPLPPMALQQEIAAKLDRLQEEVRQLKSNYGQKMRALSDLKKSLLHEAFSGNL